MVDHVPTTQADNLEGALRANNIHGGGGHDGASCDTTARNPNQWSER